MGSSSSISESEYPINPPQLLQILRDSLGLE